MTTQSTEARRHCESYITENFQRFAAEEFPDNTHNTWVIDGFESRDDLTIATATPSPDDVGYPSFKFAFHFDSQTDVVKCVAVYSFEDGCYSLLSTDRKWTKKVPRELP